MSPPRKVKTGMRELSMWEGRECGWALFGTGVIVAIWFSGWSRDKADRLVSQGNENRDKSRANRVRTRRSD